MNSYWKGKGKYQKELSEILEEIEEHDLLNKPLTTEAIILLDLWNVYCCICETRFHGYYPELEMSLDTAIWYCLSKSKQKEINHAI